MTVNANLLSAANAYRNQLKMMEGIKDAPQQSEAPSNSFSEILESAAQNAADTQYKAEAVKMDALTDGKVDLSDLVTAVSNAELTLNTVVAVRDRVINAYQEILRMPI
jgi:flagellar hook-basal body complex protein FliE